MLLWLTHSGAVAHPRPRSRAGTGGSVGYTAKVALAATALGAGVAALAPILGGNLHAVIPGAIYRSAQLDPEELTAVAAELELASVLAVRAVRPNKDWYVEEVRVARQLDEERYGLAEHMVRLEELYQQVIRCRSLWSDRRGSLPHMAA